MHADLPLGGPSLIKYQDRRDLDRMYFESRSYNVQFNLASIPDSFSNKEPAPFDLTYMKALFEAGYTSGRERPSLALEAP
jgi:hypothetical protein